MHCEQHPQCGEDGSDDHPASGGYPGIRFQNQGRHNPADIQDRGGDGFRHRPDSQVLLFSEHQQVLQGKNGQMSLTDRITAQRKGRME